ncbi:MAG: isochorismatase family protein [Clostridia bacterium]|jgi:nicotinamidase-related amidase|nr:isochorismatase family protein [Clostridia bacterium]MBT7122138.1 isochorismatase family protein [Clostridia bacterium]
MSIALLIIDLQKEYFKDGVREPELSDALEYINETSQFFRQADKPVVIIQHTGERNPLDSVGYEVVDALHVEDSDYRISKTFCNAFWQTELTALLRDMDIELVVCCGFAAQYCVLFTYNGADERGFKAALLQNGIVGINKENAQQVQQMREVISIDAIEFMLSKL